MRSINIGSPLVPDVVESPGCVMNTENVVPPNLDTLRSSTGYSLIMDWLDLVYHTSEKWLGHLQKCEHQSI